MLEPLDHAMRPGLVLRPVEVLRHLPAEDVGHERRLARPADAGHRHEGAQGNGDIDVLQVVGPSASNHELLAIALAPF